MSVIAGKFGMKNDFFYSNQTMGSLSGGEKVKTQLMRLFIRDVSVLLLDEPSNVHRHCDAYITGKNHK